MNRQKSKTADTCTLSVRIQPRASKNEISVMEDGGLKIRLTAPPVDGAANEALIRFLADTFSVTRSQVEIVSGHTSKNKIVRIEGISNGQLEEMLNRVPGRAKKLSHR
ncbi:MAG: YggU family protein [Nitrospirae bacterium GWD2_57_9]|nr:MAG: YggU family protein [Nitrospirae bacterium GWD2_57_9]